MKKYNILLYIRITKARKFLKITTFKCIPDTLTTWDTYRHTALKKKSVFKMSLEVEVTLYTRFFHVDAVAFSVIDDFRIVNFATQ